MTLKQRIKYLGGRSTDFDHLRIVLVVAILLWHTKSTSLGVQAAENAWLSPLRAAPTLLLSMFFALSGFLIAGGLERSRNISSFYT